jgi:hypothetical protein
MLVLSSTLHKYRIWHYDSEGRAMSFDHGVPLGMNGSPGFAQVVRIGAIIIKNTVFAVGLAALMWVDVEFAGRFYAMLFNAGASHHQAILFGDAISFGTSAVDIEFWSLGLYKGFRATKGASSSTKASAGHMFATVAAIVIQVGDTIAATVAVAHIAYPNMPAGNLYPSHVTQVFMLGEIMMAVVVMASTPLTALMIEHGARTIARSRERGAPMG